MESAEPIIVVLGARCGGTSAVAGVLHHLGVYMGAHYSWAVREVSDTWEDVFLAQICERAFIGALAERLPIEPDFFRAKLHSWAQQHRRAAAAAGRSPGVKNPILCAAVEFIRDAWGPIVPVAVDRPVEKVVATVMRLGWSPTEQEATEATLGSIAARDRALADTVPVRVDFEELRADPDRAIRRLVSELGLEVTGDQVQAAVRSVVRSAGGSGAGPSGAERLVAKLNRDPGDTRSMFLLGETLFQTGDFANAHKVFLKRAEMGGWDQEAYFALFRVAELTAKLGEPWPAVESAYLRAWELQPASGEPLLPIGQRYYEDNRLRLAELFAKFAAENPVPDQFLAVLAGGRDHTIAATDLQAMCEFKMGKQAAAFSRWRCLLARPDLPDDMRQIVMVKRNLAVPALLDAALSYPAAVVDALTTASRDPGITVSVIAGPDPRITAATLNSFLNCCTDISRMGRFVVVDVGLPAPDRALLEERYGFAEFVPAEPGAGAGVLLDRVHAQVSDRFWLHLGEGWRFFAPECFITRLTAVLEAEPQVFQVGINLADAAESTADYLVAHVARRGIDTGRYTLAEKVATGPAMFDTTRLGRAGGVDGAAAAGLQTACLDEVLCVAMPFPGVEGKLGFTDGSR